jgi:hypothetical protein
VSRRGHAVIASESEAIQRRGRILDCFVAFAPRNDDHIQAHTGSAIEYFTWLSAKLDSIEAMPSSRVSLFFRNAS